MRQLETSSFQSPSLLRCTEFPCKSDCTSIENRGTFTIFSVYPTERAEHAIGPLTSGLRHEHGRRHVGGHVGRRSFFSSRHPFSSSTREIASQICNFVPCSRFTERYLLDFFLSSSNLRVVNLSLSLSLFRAHGWEEEFYNGYTGIHTAIGPRLPISGKTVVVIKRHGISATRRRNSSISTRMAAVSHHHPCIVSLNGISI